MNESLVGGITGIRDEYTKRPEQDRGLSRLKTLANGAQEAARSVSQMRAALDSLLVSIEGPRIEPATPDQQPIPGTGKRSPLPLEAISLAHEDIHKSLDGMHKTLKRLNDLVG